MIYFDTSYVAKCYLNETGSSAVRQLAESQPAIASSEYARIELTSTFLRNLRDGFLTRAQFKLVLRQFESDDKSDIWIWLPVTSELCRKASTRITTLPTATFIRAGDALHLLTAQELGETEIWTKDRHLLAAAPHFGIAGRSV